MDVGRADGGVYAVAREQFGKLLREEFVSVVVVYGAHDTLRHITAGNKKSSQAGNEPAYLRRSFVLVLEDMDGLETSMVVHDDSGVAMPSRRVMPESGPRYPNG
eukprot:1472405-Pleurochrysis_carterae.AAC.5